MSDLYCVDFLSLLYCVLLFLFFLFHINFDFSVLPLGGIKFDWFRGRYCYRRHFNYIYFVNNNSNNNRNIIIVKIGYKMQILLLF